ncbi:hypothetical protein A2866_05460 [Candidatus Roizmanbacteria bacterium RIFCSPHIGHO2_01_FULL_39_8]|uniref:Glycosyltransferase 2-like domain-containing protein n=3 Tax=Candidatus Roizmaniibacteriota TaxID=1752723 RepID=A0A1F7GFZ4_9BACT|nr:MAG: hypothetical protein A2866_05460 [Candidatus Roizmanbacteria bacterium RIFCSPHIGHO2_01_FULL_39_8]OGK26617.1 MAG: hypothetical protein A3C28_03665 [Candidatus Roizmanbacteria bacterium RIFCSPHIGHO2_02_FULL_39_9]OGK34686.1 MAG: hypothetical protein A3F60_03420 [Candidatus Roizmanbacteria bacterium RIFCSPHIGHO2_12_FULL_39_8]
MVSVIITTHNSQNYLNNCLKSIAEQSYPKNKIEIIVVDNNSTDETKKIAQLYVKKLYNKGKERCSQRNFGAKKCMGKYYFYLDADMILGENVIRECVTKLEGDPKTIALYIPEIILGNKIWSAIRTFERKFYETSCIDAVRFIRMSEFRTVGGFDELLECGEDWDLDRRVRMRGKVDIITSPLYHDEQNLSLINYLKKKKYYLDRLKGYIEKWGKDDKDIVKQFGPLYRFFVVFVEKDKWKSSLKKPHLLLLTLSLKILVGMYSFLASDTRATSKVQ